MNYPKYFCLTLLLIGYGFLTNCSEEESPSSPTPSPAAPSNYGKGGDVLINPISDTRISSKPIFTITFGDVVHSVIMDSVDYPGKPNSTLNSSQNSTLCLRANSNSNCEALSVVFNNNSTIATITPLNHLNEGSYIFTVAGSILTSIGSLGEDQTFRYTVVYPHGGAIQNRLISLVGDGNTLIGSSLLDGPRGLATDGTYLYVADTYNEKIQKITLASSVTNFFNLNSLQDEVQTLLKPVDVTVSSTHLYILDQGFRRVLEVPLVGGTPTSIAGGGSAGYADGIGISAQFNSPNAITNTKDSEGMEHIFVADTCNNTIRRIDPFTNIVTSLLPPEPGCGSGSSDSDKLKAPVDLTTNGEYLYIADRDNSAIKRIDLNDCKAHGWQSCVLNPLPIPISLNKPISIITDGSYLYVGTNDHKIHRYDLNGSPEYNDLFPISAITPQSLTTDGQSLIYSEEGRNRVVRLHSKGFDNEEVLN
ncbi:MAG: hypothetical protein P8O70_13765 [SAR324 cluster bacterium]|nr:hypothetical protein [SAR324 cluster bacterium]